MGVQSTAPEQPASWLQAIEKQWLKNVSNLMLVRPFLDRQWFGRK
jgi:hypothetical protein